IFVQGAVLVSASPGLPQFVKAALGFRLGYSPTERGYNQKINYGAEKKGVGVQLLSGANNGGWHQGQQQGGLQAAGSGYGSGIGGGREGPLAAHVGHGAVKHLRILGLNLYLGGRAAHLAHGQGGQHHGHVGQGAQHHGHVGQGGQHHGYVGHGHGVQHKAPLLKKPLLLSPFKPLSALFGIRPSVHFGGKPSGAPHTVGGVTGLRAAVGTQDYGVGFKVGYRQGVNTKSTLAQVLTGGLGLGLGAAHGGTHGKYSYVPSVHKGQDQAYVHGNNLLKGHGHNQNNQYSGYGQLDSPVSGLESKHQFSTQLLAQGSQLQQLQPQGPIRIPYIPQHNGLRMVLAPNPQAHPQQHSRHNNNGQHWSTIFPSSSSSNGPHSAASNHFINPLPPNGQSLTKLQASLQGPVASAQNQIPYIQHQQPQRPHYQGYSLNGYQGPFAQPNNRYQNNFYQQPQQQQQSNHYSQQSSPQFPQEYNLFQQQSFNSPLQSFQNNAPSHYSQQPQQHNQQNPQSLNSQQTPFFSQIQEQPLSSPQQLEQHSQQQQQSQNLQSQNLQSQNLQSQNFQSQNFPNLPQIPFTADSMPFQPDPNFQYTHSTSSEPVSMGSYTMDMDISNQDSNNGNAPGPLVGPLGRRLKKAKRARADVIIKKSDTVEADTKDLETSASSNAILMASSLGSTSWTPLVMIEPPKLSKKSLETTPSIPEKKQQQEQQAVIKPKSQKIGASISVLPTVASTTNPSDHGQDDRSMILKKRRLNFSGEVTGPTVIPTTTLPLLLLHLPLLPPLPLL
ncbi:hypothetical protein Ocin01_02196, partial [Orchesella cincta]